METKHTPDEALLDYRKPKHTPGPWFVGELVHSQVRNADGLLVMDCDMGVDNDLPSVPESEANARLIAAAPELLDGGKRLIQLLHNFVDLYANAAAKKLLESDSVQTLKAAIAKAEGL